ncbi:MAG: acetyltransferase [candidate division Zixibacteria bacterium]|nr:acetyltransferase [candidate division Zixibacteria bacterium]
MQKIVILGVGGNCIDILDTIRDINDDIGRPHFECVGFLDDKPSSHGMLFGDVKCLGPLNQAGELGDCLFVNGIGSTANFWHKRRIIESTGVTDDRFATIIHPTASISRMATLGPGTVVFQHATVTTNVTVGRHVIILPQAVISHDVTVGDYTCITGGVCISGGATIEQSCYLGSNCTIGNNLTIGEYSLIGMGSTVVKDVPRNCVMVGTPAGFLRRTNENL